MSERPVAAFWRERVHEQGFRPEAPRNGAAYWSGGPANRARAEQFAAEQSAAGRECATLEMTLDGHELDRADLFAHPDVSKAEAREVWCKASHRYAELTKGQVNTFVVGSHASSHFRSQELPALVRNRDVVAINGIPRERLAQTYEKDPGRAYFDICDAELERDRTRATQLADRALLDDVEARSLHLKETRDRERPLARGRVNERD